MKNFPQDRGYAANRLVLELDGPGHHVGTLRSIEGGDLRTAPISYRHSTQPHASYLAGRPRYEDITIQVGMTMAPRFWNWLKASFSYQAERRNGALVGLDFDHRERWRRSFQGALITEVRFPALDSSATAADYLTVKFAVESITPGRERRRHDAEREEVREWERQTQWLPSSFTFRVDQFPRQELRTTRIESFAIQQPAIDCPCGAELEARKAPGLLTFPNLEVTMLEPDAGPWLSWYEAFRQGRNGADSERSGHISFLPRVGDRQRPLLTLDLLGLGVLRVQHHKSQAGRSDLATVKVELFCDSMDLKPGPGTVRV